MIKTRKIKIRPDSYSWLNSCADEVNLVWNWANETSFKALTPFAGKRKFLSGYDLINLSSGCSSHMTYLPAHSAQLICMQYSNKRAVVKKFKLKWRSSKGSRRALGWIPLKPTQMAKRKRDRFKFAGKTIRLFESIEGMKFKQGCFAQDSLGDWYLCMPYEAEVAKQPAKSQVIGIDLGLKTVATCSNGDKLEMSFYRDSENKLAQLQKRGHKKQAKYLNRKIKNQRAHATHVFTTNVVNNYQNIFIGDLNFNFIKSGNSSKAAYDGAIGMVKTQLLYKSQQAGRWVKLVDEKFSTQACSACGSITGPKGASGLVVRKWQCSECGTEHDRDINAAINIATFGMKHHPPCAGTTFEFTG